MIVGLDVRSTVQPHDLSERAGAVCSQALAAIRSVGDLSWRFAIDYDVARPAEASA